jgi:hypothetical protein
MKDRDRGNWDHRSNDANVMPRGEPSRRGRGRLNSLANITIVLF